MKRIVLMTVALNLLASSAYGSADTAELPAIQQRRIVLGPKTATLAYTTFPEAYCNVRNVESIEIFENSLVELPSCIARFGRTAITFDIKKNLALIALPSEIGFFVRLETLNVTGSGLTTLPPQIAGAKALRYLHLSNNKISSLPKEIGDLTTLESLDLSGNQITSDALPVEMGKLTSLRVLNLGGNNLTKAPSFLPYLVNLEKLILTGNSLLDDNERAVITAIFKDRPSKEKPTIIVP